MTFTTSLSLFCDFYQIQLDPLILDPCSLILDPCSLILDPWSLILDLWLMLIMNGRRWGLPRVPPPLLRFVTFSKFPLKVNLCGGSPCSFKRASQNHFLAPFLLSIILLFSSFDYFAAFFPPFVPETKKIIDCPTCICVSLEYQFVYPQTPILQSSCCKS